MCLKPIEVQKNEGTLASFIILLFIIFLFLLFFLFCLYKLWLYFVPAGWKNLDDFTFNYSPYVSLALLARVFHISQRVIQSLASIVEG